MNNFQTPPPETPPPTPALDLSLDNCVIQRNLLRKRRYFKSTNDSKRLHEREEQRDISVVTPLVDSFCGVIDNEGSNCNECEFRSINYYDSDSDCDDRDQDDSFMGCYDEDETAVNSSIVACGDAGFERDCVGGDDKEGGDGDHSDEDEDKFEDGDMDLSYIESYEEDVQKETSYSIEIQSCKDSLSMSMMTSLNETESSMNLSMNLSLSLAMAMSFKRNGGDGDNDNDGVENDEELDVDIKENENQNQDDANTKEVNNEHGNNNNNNEEIVKSMLHVPRPIPTITLPHDTICNINNTLTPKSKRVIRFEMGVTCGSGSGGEREKVRRSYRISSATTTTVGSAHVNKSSDNKNGNDNKKECNNNNNMKRIKRQPNKPRDHGHKNKMYETPKRIRSSLSKLEL